MAEQEKCCGTCKWWSFKSKRHTNLGLCDCPLPESLEGADVTIVDMPYYSGSTCSCHTPKERP